MKVHIRKALLADLDDPAVDIRHEDELEWIRGGGIPMRQSFQLCLDRTELALVATIEGVPQMWWGGSKGILWMFATKTAAKRAISLHRALLPQVDMMHDRWGTLQCFCDVENIKHHQWLDWLGFERQQVFEMGPYDHQFWHYKKEP